MLFRSEQLGVDPSLCVAYEASEAGLESAIAAGIGTVVDIRVAR